MLEKVTDIHHGTEGLRFEDTLLRAFDMVGLSYDKNSAKGAGWDFRPKGAGWKPLIGEKDVNVKVSTAKWLFGTSDLVKALPWDGVPDDFDFDKAALNVKKILIRRGVHELYFLKPISKEIQNKIAEAVSNRDGEELVKLLVKRNFKLEHLGRGFDVSISQRDGRIGSIAIKKGGKIFARSERPRERKRGTQVAFRMPTSYKMPATNVAKKGTDVITRVAAGESVHDVLDEILAEITTSASIAKYPKPMGVVRKTRKDKKKQESAGVYFSLSPIPTVPQAGVASPLTTPRPGLKYDFDYDPWRKKLRRKRRDLSLDIRSK